MGKATWGWALGVLALTGTALVLVLILSWSPSSPSLARWTPACIVVAATACVLTLLSPRTGDWGQPVLKIAGGLSLLVIAVLEVLRTS